jgi:hypothetical protein
MRCTLEFVRPLPVCNAVWPNDRQRLGPRPKTASLSTRVLTQIDGAAPQWRRSSSPCRKGRGFVPVEGSSMFIGRDAVCSSSDDGHDMLMRLYHTPTPSRSRRPTRKPLCRGGNPSDAREFSRAIFDRLVGKVRPQPNFFGDSLHRSIRLPLYRRQLIARAFECQDQLGQLERACRGWPGSGIRNVTRGAGVNHERQVSL